MLGVSFTPNTVNVSVKQKPMIENSLRLMKPIVHVVNGHMESAEEVFKTAISYIDLNMLDQACQEFEKVKQYATEGSSLDVGFESKIYLSRLMIFSQLLMVAYDKNTKSFIPFEKLELEDKNVCGILIKNRCDKLRQDSKQTGRTGEKNQNNQMELDNFLKSVYPILAICCNKNVPSKYLESLPTAILNTQYLPYGEYSATLLPLGFLVNDEDYKEMNIFIWKEKRGDMVLMRLKQRVFQIPNTNTDEISIQLRLNLKKSSLYQCYFSPPDDPEPVQCKEGEPECV